MNRHERMWHLRLAEIGPLRAELNAAIDRTNWNEMFCLGFLASTYAYMFNDPIDFFDFLLSIVVLVVLCFGARRYWELRCHIKKLDQYLLDSEKLIGGGVGGWGEVYAKSLTGSDTGGYSITRSYAWALAIVISVVVITYCYWSMKKIL